MANKYEIIISWSDEDDAFIGWVSELPGCMAHGATREAALQSVQEAIALWLKTAQEFGDPTPEPRCGPHVAAWERPLCEFRDAVVPPAAAPATVPAV